MNEISFVTRICSRCSEEKVLSDFCSDRNKKYGKSYHCRACGSVKDKKRYYGDLDGQRARGLEYFYRRHEHHLAVQREKRRLFGHGYDPTTDRPAYRRYRAERRSRLSNATPAWLTADDKTFMDITYRMADLLGAELGIPMEVDHITPLAGRNICGLHVPLNLQVIPKIKNRSKGNRVESYL